MTGVYNKNILFLSLLSVSLTACSGLPSWMGGKSEEKQKIEGERKIALTVEGKLKVDGELKNSKPSLPTPVRNSEWLQHSGQFTAATANIAGSKFSTQSSAEVGGGNDFTHTLVPRPVVVGGMVYAMDAAGIISAHDANDINNIRWTSTAIADEDEDDVIGGGIAAGGNVVYAVTGQGQVAAFSASDGKLIWEKTFDKPFRASPRFAEGRLIIVAIDNHSYALSAKNGEILWDHRGMDETSAVMNNVSPTVSGRDVLVPYSSGELFALSIVDGKELWSDTLQKMFSGISESFAGIGGDPVVDGNIVFVAGNNGITAAVNMLSGQRIWQQQLSSINTPWLAGDEIFILSEDNILINMVKYTGKIRWLTKLASYEYPETKESPINWRGAVLSDGKLFVIGSNGEMKVVSALNGDILETKEIPDNIVTAPVIAGGVMYLVGQDATLYSFR